MMKELDEEATGIIIGGQNFNNIRYADDAVFMSDEEHSLQEIVQKIADICNAYGMEINVKKTKTMVISKTGNIPCSIAVNNIALEQVPQYKYLGSWITEDSKCEMDIETRIGMAKDAFLEAQTTVERQYQSTDEESNTELLCLSSRKICL